MANTITGTLASVTTTEEQAWNTLFPTMYTFTGTISDQDAVALTAIGEFDVTMTGVALNDMVLGISIGKDLDDGTDQCSASAHISAADTVTVQLSADNAEFAADDLNTAAVHILIGRPGW